MEVKCKNSSGYPHLKDGNIYTVTELNGQLITLHFTFPRYVCVIDDSNNLSMCHAYKFETLDGQCLDEYIKENVQDTTDKEY